VPKAKSLCMLDRRANVVHRRQITQLIRRCVIAQQQRIDHPNLVNSDSKYVEAEDWWDKDCKGVQLPLPV